MMVFLWVAVLFKRKSVVMPGLDPGIHVLLFVQGVDGRDDARP
jgi:hypothetical protein